MTQTTNGENHTTEVIGSKVIEKVNGKTVSEHDLSHVLAGYKATLSNANTSQEAKAVFVHAELKIAELEKIGSHKEHEKDPSHVIGGLKACLKNEHTSEEAKEHARERLRELEVEFDDE